MYVGVKASDKRRIKGTTVLCASAAGSSVAGPAVSFIMGNGSGFQKFGVDSRTLTSQELRVSTRSAIRICFFQTPGTDNKSQKVGLLFRKLWCLVELVCFHVVVVGFR